MLKIRLIFIKQFAFRHKVRHRQVLFRKEIDQKKSWLTYSYEKKWCSLPWSGSWGRHAQTNALRDDLKDNCNRFCTKLQIKKIHNTHTHLWRILRYKSIIDKVSLKLHKASYKTFCLNTVNFFSVCDKRRLQTCRWTR